MGLFWHRLRWRAVATALPADIPFDLLDVGAGAGFAGEYLRGGFPAARYFFIEPLASLEAGLVRRFGAERNLGGATAFGGIRFVLLLDVLEHQQDDRTFLRELIAKMQPGATLIVTVPALPWLWSEWDAVLGHFRRYDRATLRAVLADCPVRIHDPSYLFPELVPAGLLRRCLPRGAAGKGSGEFPLLPSAANALLYWLGRCSMPVARFLPFGTSLYMRVEKC